MSEYVNSEGTKSEFNGSMDASPVSHPQSLYFLMPVILCGPKFALSCSETEISYHEYSITICPILSANACINIE